MRRRYIGKRSTWNIYTFIYYYFFFTENKKLDAVI